MYRYKLAALAAAATLASFGTAIGQTTPPSPPSASPPAKDAPPVPGANSFTEAQAKGRIEKAGFSQVTGLRKDDQGIWRGKAMQRGKQVNVALDFRGNVVPTQ